MSNKQNRTGMRQQEQHQTDDGKVKVKRRVIHFVMCVLAFCVVSNTFLALGWIEYAGWKVDNFDLGYSFLNVFLPLMAILFLWLLVEES